MRTDLVSLTVDQVLEDLLLDVQLSTSSRAARSADAIERGPAHSPQLDHDSPLLTSARIESQYGTSTSDNAARHTHSASHMPEDSDANIIPVATENTASAAALQPSVHAFQLSESADIATRLSGFPEGRSSKLLALKQKRLDSLSSSLDLSRESSFDTSGVSAQQSATKLQNNIEGQPSSYLSVEPTASLQPSLQQQNTPQEQASLDSTSGESWYTLQVLLHERASTTALKDAPYTWPHHQACTSATGAASHCT